MFWNFLKIAFRNISSNAGYAIINISSLSVGMAVAMLIGLWVYDELSANKHFKNYRVIYQVLIHESNDGHISTSWATPFPLGDELKSKYSDFSAVAMCDGGGKHSLATGDKKVVEEGYFIGDDAPKMFSLEVLYGAETPFHDPYSIILTDAAAKKLFNTANAVGKIVKMDNACNLTVTAIVKKEPENSSLTFDFLLPWKLQTHIYPGFINYLHEWDNNSWRTYVQLNKDAEAETVNEKIKYVVFNHLSRKYQASKSIVELFPMAKWRLYSDFENGKNVGGFIKYVRLFGVLGFVTLFIACINFTNLSTARSLKRAKEIGIRKAIGSTRMQLVEQFLIESLLVATVAFLLSAVAVALLLPYFNLLTHKHMTLFIDSSVFWSFAFSLIILTGLTAGSYPAFYISSFKAVKVLKGKINLGTGNILPRKILVIFQFACSIVLTLCTLIIYRQIHYGKERPVGYQTNGLISVNYSPEMSKNFYMLQNDLLASGAVLSLCESNSAPTEICCSTNRWEWPESKPSDYNMGINTIATTYGFTRTLGIQLHAGRDFSHDYGTDTAAVLLNQAAVSLMRLKNPVGETIKWNGQKRTIIGIVPNLEMESPFQSISPMIIKFSRDWVNNMIMRINPGISTAKALSVLKPIFEKSNVPFEYQFADEAYASKFDYEELVAKFAMVVTIIAIVISFFGLFGLATFMTQQRAKEIAVRKLLGATVTSLWRLLSMEFVLLVTVSSSIGIPIAYCLMNKWMKNYQYHTYLSWWIFGATAIGAFIVTVLTVSYQSIKAACTNPVQSLKSE